MKVCIDLRDQKQAEVLAVFVSGRFRFDCEIQSWKNCQMKNDMFFIMDHGAEKEAVDACQKSGAVINFFCLTDGISDDEELSNYYSTSVFFIPRVDAVLALELVLEERFGKDMSLVESVDFFPISPSMCMGLSHLSVKVYMQIDDRKYMRVLKEGDLFSEYDFQFFTEYKNQQNLYIKRSDVTDFAKNAWIDKGKKSALKSFDSDSFRDRKQKAALLHERFSKINVLPKFSLMGDEEGKELFGLLPHHDSSWAIEKPRVQLVQIPKVADIVSSVLHNEVPESIPVQESVAIKREDASVLRQKAQDIIRQTVDIPKVVMPPEVKKHEPHVPEVLLKQEIAVQESIGLDQEIVLLQKTIRTRGVTYDVEKKIQEIEKTLLDAVKRGGSVTDFLTPLSRQRSLYVATHVILLAYVSCALATLMDWKSDTTYIKLILASLMHDITLENPELASIQTLNELSRKKNFLVAKDIAAFHEHMDAAALIVQKISDVPADVDSIISQHHERPNGDGFPKKINHSKIIPLACVFIVAHDLVNFLLKSVPANTEVHALVLERFVKQYPKAYQVGNFRKVLAVVQRLKV